MTETNFPPTPPAGPESQKERWLKYGGNVALMTVIVILLAAGVIYATEKKSKRVDTTTTGLYSLKPQTINLIRANTQKIQITSLYTKAKPSEQDQAVDVAAMNVSDQAEKVADLLDEYKNKGTNIDVDSIDPVISPAKVEDLVADVTERYGGQVKKYKEFATAYPGKYKAITDAAAVEVANLKPLVEAKDVTEDVVDFANSLARTVREMPQQLQLSKGDIERELKQKVPNYKGVAEKVQESVAVLSQIFDAIVGKFKELKDNKQVPEAIRKYMTDSLPRYEKLKQSADELANEAKNLGELKLDTLRDALRQRNSILVRGEKEWKIISYDQVWKVDNRARASEGASLKPRFAGEQMITTAILALTHPTKLKVAFVRAGGPTVTESGNMFSEGGRLSFVADALREYNYEVVEKDLTGMSAMQQQQQMAPPEPSEADIKDAVWVVVNRRSGQSQFGPAPTISSKVAEHLANGGSALFIAEPQSDDMALALKDYGITLRTDALLLHEQVKSEGEQGEMIERVKRNPMFFEIRDWGKHELTGPVQSLPGIIFQAIPVITTPTKGVKSAALLPIPDAPSNPKSWGKTHLDAIRGVPTFEPDKGDLAGPLFAGAAAEKDGGSRVVALGSIEMVVNGVVNFLDPELEEKRIFVVRFPGNSEVFANSVYWLSHQETLIATSPAAMEVSRIENLSKGAQNFWRVGVLLLGVPMLVILAGAMVYFARRD